MSLNIKDPIFGFSGEPGVVKDFSKESQKIKIDTDRKAVNKELRHGYISGMTADQKIEFNSFMDKIQSIEDIDEKVKLLQEKVTQLTGDINPNSGILLGYYKSELSHIMHTHHYSPRYYSIHSTKIP